MTTVSRQTDHTTVTMTAPIVDNREQKEPKLSKSKSHSSERRHYILFPSPLIDQGQYQVLYPV